MPFVTDVLAERCAGPDLINPTERRFARRARWLMQKFHLFSKREHHILIVYQ